MTEYEVKVEGNIRSGLTVDGLAELYAGGVVNRETECRALPEGPWKTIDALFPLLEYRARGGEGMLAPSSVRPPEGAAVRPQPQNSAIRAGWICIAVGLVCAWVFPPANLFFSVAMVLSIVAMCTHQVGRGFVLLLSAFAGVALSVFLTLTLMGSGVVAALQTMDDGKWTSWKDLFMVPATQGPRELSVVPQPTAVPVPISTPVSTPRPRPIPARPIAPVRPTLVPTATPSNIPSVQQQIAREQQYRVAMDSYNESKKLLAENIAVMQERIRKARYNGDSAMVKIWEKELDVFKKQEEKLKKPVY